MGGTSDGRASTTCFLAGGGADTGGRLGVGLCWLGEATPGERESFGKDDAVN